MPSPYRCRANEGDSDDRDASHCRCAQLPSSVNHLVVFTVPLVYPCLPLSQAILSAVEGMPLLKGAMTKTGVGAGIIDK